MERTVGCKRYPFYNISPFYPHEIPEKIKGPDNPTCQLLSIMSNKCCSGTGKEGKTKEVVKDQDVKTVVCDKVVCERWCVKRWCV